MPKIKQYKPEEYKFNVRALKPERPYVKVQRPKPIGADDEALTGIVDGQAASDIEERFALALRANVKVSYFEFRKVIIAPRLEAGSIEIDFLVHAGTIWPIQTDGEYFHKSAEARAHDELQDSLTDQYLSDAGYAAQPSTRIAGERLSTQEQANSVVRELIG
jgi:hypothetical protein